MALRVKSESVFVLVMALRAFDVPSVMVWEVLERVVRGGYGGRGMLFAFEWERT